MKQVRLLQLDGLRLIAALSIALAHFANTHAIQFPSISALSGPLAGIGMPLFFVLSGFVIHYNYHGLADRTITRRAFAAARIARLYPLFLLILLYALLKQPTTTVTFSLLTGSTEYYPALFHFLTMTQSWWYFVAHDQQTIYSMGIYPALAWSISTEVALYLFYCLACPYMKRVKDLRLHLGIGLALYLLWIALFVVLTAHRQDVDGWATSQWGPIAADKHLPQFSFFFWLTYNSPFVRLMEFSLGMLAAGLYLRTAADAGTQTGRRIGHILTYTVTAVILGLMALIYWLAYTHALNTLQSLPRQLLTLLYTPSLLYGLFIGLLIYLLVRYDTTLARLLSSRYMVKGGEASYSIYLLHMVVFDGVSMYPVTNGITATRVIAIAMATLSVALLLLLARGSYVIFEMPAKGWVMQMYRSNRLTWVGIPWLALLVWLVTAPGLRVGPIEIEAATYGASCGATAGNATRNAMAYCQGLQRCRYYVDIAQLGDPKPGCLNDFIMDWHCRGIPTPQHLYLPAEAGALSRVRLSCDSPTGTKH